ncbi:tetratricopeptide repeat protein [candidate division GN15 bacterium]|nr:tetratricopeptide repeat protein [candidate division GN15 bacterium]
MHHQNVIFRSMFRPVDNIGPNLVDSGPPTPIFEAMTDKPTNSQTSDQSNTNSTDATENVTTNHYRDILIVLGVVALFTIGFFVFREPGTPPQPPQAASVPGHSGMDSELLAGLPNDFGSLVQEGNKQMDDGRYVLAAEIYRRALAINPSVADVRVDFGTCLFAMGLPERAQEEFTTVLNAQPDHAIANFNMGIVYNHLGKVDSARVYWERLLALQPTGATADRARDLLEQTAE